MAYSYLWPPSLPRAPRLGGYSETRGINILRTSMDAGPAKLRRRSNRPDTIQCVYRLDTAQLNTFRTFVDTTIGGVSRFGWPHPRTKQTVEARIVPADDGLYTVTALGRKYWDVQVTIEVLP